MGYNRQHPWSLFEHDRILLCQLRHQVSDGYSNIRPADSSVAPAPGSWAPKVWGTPDVLTGAAVWTSFELFECRY